MNNETLQKKFEWQFLGLKKIYIKYEPYNFIKDGAPEDEHDGEIMKILSGLREVRSETETCQLIDRVLSAAYGEGPSNSELASEVYLWWLQNNE